MPRPIIKLNDRQRARLSEALGAINLIRDSYVDAAGSEGAYHWTPDLKQLYPVGRDGKADAVALDPAPDGVPE